MAEQWRLIRTGFNDAFTNMAIDEAILNSVVEAAAPNTVRFYRWKPSAVSIGFSQQVEKEVEVETCKTLGVDVVRRPTGGGAVYHDSDGELTYSIIARSDIVPSDVISSYRYLCHGIVMMCRNLGLNAQLSFDDKGRQCPNVTVNGKKISGSAQTRRKNAFLQHGTILLDSNLEIVTKVLKMGLPTACMPLEKLASKVTTMKYLLGKSLLLDEFENNLRLAFEKAFHTKIPEQALTTSELKQASELRSRKYATEEWNFKRQRGGNLS